MSEILVVAPDQEGEWGLICTYLEGKGYSVSRAVRAGEAYLLARTKPPAAILADDDLQGVSALSLLRKMKVLVPQAETIFLSRKPTLAKAIRTMKEGAYDYYELPVDKRLLIAVLDKALEKHLLMAEKSELERKVKEKYGFSEVIGRSKVMQNLLETVSSVSKKNVTILLTGHTGTGKELIANAVHYHSLRAEKPFVRASCASFNEGVIESELFGHERGAFTGAVSRRIGRFELAEGGTIFLDEVGDIPPGTQVKLLRVLQEREFERLGGNDPVRIDVRIVAATNRNLEMLVKEGKFREDLYYRLNVVHIELPTLEQRKEDIPRLTSHFIDKLNREKGYRMRGITKDAMQILLNYRWPGNVRELENAIESAMALAKKSVIESQYLPAFLLRARPQDSEFYQVPQNIPLREMEQEIIKLTLQKTGGNKTRAAGVLGIGLRTLQRKCKDMEGSLKTDTSGAVQ